MYLCSDLIFVDVMCRKTGDCEWKGGLRRFASTNDV